MRSDLSSNKKRKFDYPNSIRVSCLSLCGSSGRRLHKTAKRQDSDRKRLTSNGDSRDIIIFFFFFFARYSRRRMFAIRLILCCLAVGVPLADANPLVKVHPLLQSGTSIISSFCQHLIPPRQLSVEWPFVAMLNVPRLAAFWPFFFSSRRDWAH